MKILFLTNHFNPGGVTTYVLTLARSLSDQGHEVIVGSSGGALLPELQASGVRHVFFPFDVKCDIHPRLIKAAALLAVFSRSEKVDIIHAQTRVTQVAASIASSISGAVALSTCHGFFRPHLGRRLFPCWGRAVIAISNPVKEHLIRDFGLSPAAIKLIPNGIDLGLFLPLLPDASQAVRRKWGIPDVLTFGIVARLSDVKGHQDLIRAIPLVLKAYPASQCLIFGEGPMEEVLKNQARALGLLGTTIRFFPVVNKTAEILPLLDVFVMPSLQEGLGLSVLEAAAMKIPSVVTRVGGLPEIVRDQDTGLIVNPRDPAHLAAALVDLLSNPSKRIAMGEKARDFVMANYTASAMVDSTKALYETVRMEALR